VPGNLCGDGDDNAVAIGLTNGARWHSMIGKSAGKAPPYFLIPGSVDPTYSQILAVLATSSPAQHGACPGSARLGPARPARSRVF
jgi:hypothetical protein